MGDNCLDNCNFTGNKLINKEANEGKYSYIVSTNSWKKKKTKFSFPTFYNPVGNIVPSKVRALPFGVSAGT